MRESVQFHSFISISKLLPLNRPNCELMYNFNELAVTMNEPEDHVAPTDSRNRPDQRLMETGYWEEANQEKLRLEDKQRSKRKKRESEAATAAEAGMEIIEKLCFTIEL